MNGNKDSYPGKEHFHRVYALHEETSLEWEELQRDAPFLPRGWFELSRLPKEDRIEFTQGFWLSKLPVVSAKLENRLEAFFDLLDDLGIFLVQVKPHQPFDVHMVYSLQDEVGYFQGGPPASEQAIFNLEKAFPSMRLPSDYLDFLRIHDGFSKYTDTGTIKVKEMPKIYQRFQELFSHDLPLRSDGEVANPHNLIPFYESYGLHCYQCFYADWYPEEEMGNVYFTQSDNRISNFFDPAKREENCAFPTFLSWLIYYLEDLSHM